MRSEILPQPKHLVLYFQVHQPYRLRKFRFFDIGSGLPYFDENLNRTIMERVARDCYLPANSLLLSLIRKYPQIRITFSISGTTLEQLHEYTPEVLQSFRDLASSGSVEFLGETNYHSLACLKPGDEFEIQVLQHAEKMLEFLGVRPTFFRNTELIYSNDVGERINRLGFLGTFCDGAERILRYRNAHHLYRHPDIRNFKLFVRSYRLSDDIAFRFNQPSERLTVKKYISWLTGIPAHEQLITLGMDYETFGEHHKKETSIFKFLKELLKSLAQHKHFKMVTPTEAGREIKAEEMLPVHQYVSWADLERDLSAWLGNAMQQDAYDCLMGLEKDVKKINDPGLLKSWRYLQTSDHFYYMSTKSDTDGGIHSYFSPYDSPYEAFINYMNVLSDFSENIRKRIRQLDAYRQLSNEPVEVS